MLKPDTDRVDYGEELQPPEGYILDYAVGCTYSLSLDILISIPISLALSSEMNVDKDKGKLQLLDGVIKTMDKIKVYCQRGKISVPANEMTLYSLLEKSIYQVLPNENTSFHPKVWVIRYKNKDKKRKPKYKVIVLSRNLTGDRSYDISMAIDGDVTSKIRLENKGLCDFVSYLNSKDEFKDSKAFIRDLKKVEFSFEESGINDISFIPIIEGKYESDLLTKKCDDLLIISPFLSDRRLKDIYNTSKVKPRLISRKNELMKCNQRLLKLFDCYHLRDEIVDGESILDSEKNDDIRKQDIHSKIYIKDIGKKTEIYLGSPNCSSRAFDKNVEFLVKLEISKRKYGVSKAFDDLIGINKEVSLSIESDKEPSLFTKYIESEFEIDEDSEEVEKLLDEMESKISALEFVGQVENEDNNNYRIIVNTNNYLKIENIYQDIVITLRPLTLRNNRTKLKEKMFFNDIVVKDITSFFIVNIKYRDNEREIMLKIDIENIPEDRDAAIVKGILSNEKSLLNYISFLLENTSALEIARLNEAVAGESLGESGINWMKKSMFEKLLKAASRDRQKIKDVKYIMDLLGDDSIVPEDLKNMFKVFENYN